jgi:hypothetical protein
MPKHVQARVAQDEQEERQLRKLARSHHAPADWKLHAQMVIESWAGKTPKEIALTLDCHPKTVRTHLRRFNPETVQCPRDRGIGHASGIRPQATLDRARTQQDSRTGQTAATRTAGEARGWHTGRAR